jgi:hypothetical protein
MSDTPKTDQAKIAAGFQAVPESFLVFARELERENAALRAALEAMVSANDGVAVYPTPEAKAQNAALKLAKAALTAARKEQP